MIMPLPGGPTTISAQPARPGRGARIVQAIANRKPSLFSNTLTNLTWYIIVLAQGFILPRLISDHLGREILGVWDLGWSLVFYTGLLALGTRGAVARYVARFRAMQDWNALNQVVNSSLLLLVIGGAIGLVAAGAFAYCVPYFLTNSSPGVLSEARWVIFLLSASAALSLPGGVFNGVITGSERFDMLNLARGARDIGLLVAGVALLNAKLSLAWLAAAVLATELIGDFSKYIAAKRLIPTLSISVRNCRWASTKEMLSFGGKTVVRNLCRGGTYQFNSLLMTYFLGPSVLAIFARQRSPVSHAMKFMNQYAQVFIPKSSSLDASRNDEALQRLLILSTKYGLYLTLPMIALLLVMGTPLMTVWMGADYVSPAALAIFTISHALLVPQQSAYSILMGINRHGRASVYEIAGLILSILLGVVLMGPLRMGIIGGALAVSIPLALSNGVWVPLHACRCLNLKVSRYVRESLPGPLLASIPCFAVLLLARIVSPRSDWISLGIGLGSMVLVMGPVYWFAVLPSGLRERVVKQVSNLFPGSWKRWPREDQPIAGPAKGIVHPDRVR
ncbi:MAG: polysaccharide biosynthesis protein [Phycisphaerae bacterium]|nr:polysaccharide biosynthesis protein [Phycisphaerae bacterium]